MLLLPPAGLSCRGIETYAILRIYSDAPAIACFPASCGESSMEGTTRCPAESSDNQNTKSTKIQKITTLTDIILEATPMGCVKAQGELSRSISITCQKSRTEERI